MMATLWLLKDLIALTPPGNDVGFDSLPAAFYIWLVCLSYKITVWYDFGILETVSLEACVAHSQTKGQLVCCVYISTFHSLAFRGLCENRAESSGESTRG